MADSSSSGGVGFFGLLGLLFIGLKLAGQIDWSWWWVLSPFWGGLALIPAIVVLALIVRLIAGILPRIPKLLHKIFARKAELKHIDDPPTGGKRF